MRVDLHRHLEGSHSAAALAVVAARFGLKDPLFLDETTGLYHTAEALAPKLRLDGPSDDATLFYACIERARRAYVHLDAIRELSRLAFLEAAAETDGVEMRVSLFSMTRTLLAHEHVVWRELPPETFAERARGVLLAVLGGRDDAAHVSPVPMLVRVGFSRTFESESHYRALVPVLREHRPELCGLDVLGIVTGADKEPMPEALRDMLEQLRPDFKDLTVHAGEFEDHSSVERTLSLEPQGIGHGVHSVGSESVLARLRDDGVTLEVCPSSNRLLIPSAIAALEQHAGCAPLRALQRAGVHCVLGSDDPTPLGTSFAEEWQVAVRLGVDMERLQQDSARRWAQLVG
ncbi:MAG: hypothetical protein ACO3JL_04170 [Myxococcota bacterium]